MFENIENLKVISSFHKPGKNYNKIENKTLNAFIIRVSGSVLYEFEDKSIITNPGEMIFLPKGISYEARTVSNDVSVYTSINFQGDLQNPVPTLYPLDNFYDATYISKHFSDHWNMGTAAERYKCISIFYNLLSYISTIENSSYAEKKKFEIIEPAIVYLKKNIYDHSLKIDQLHHLCGISNTYFRHIFISHFNMTPQNYVLSKRISHAKSALESCDFNTIAEVALSVGFNDPLYFSKLFKKKYGVSPSEITKY